MHRQKEYKPIQSSQSKGPSFNDNIITKGTINSGTLSPKMSRTKSAEEPRKHVILTEEEKSQFGNRCPQGFKKLSLLGKGGIAIVWLAIDLESGEHVAMKQFPKKGGKFDSSAGVEIQIQKVIAKAISGGCPGKSKPYLKISFQEEKTYAGY